MIPRCALLVADGDGEGAYVRLAHEALVTHWERAKRQIAQDRDDLRTRAIIEAAESEWRTADARRKQEHLLRDPHLAGAVDLASRWADEFDKETLSFIQASRRRARLRQQLTAALAVVFALVAVAAIAAMIVADRERAKTQQSLDYLLNVKETYQELAGFVPEETEQLMRESADAFLTGAVDAPDSAKLLQVGALEEMAHISATHGTISERQGSWIPPIKDCIKSVRSVHRGGNSRSSPQDCWKSPPIWTPTTRVHMGSLCKNTRALVILGADRETKLDRARVHRRIAQSKIALSDFDAADPHINEARSLLDKIDDAPSERANFDDVLARELGWQGKSGEALQVLQDAVALDRKALANARSAAEPISQTDGIARGTFGTSWRALRRAGQESATSAYDEAEELAIEVLKTYPNQSSTRFMIDLIRHGNALLVRNGLSKTNRATRLATIEAAANTAFASGFGRFKFEMTAAEVNRLVGSPLTDAQFSKLGRAYEYTTDEVRYFWVPIANVADFREFYEDPSCLVSSHNPYPNDLPDYVVFMFHEDALIRMSVRLYGNARAGCPDHHALFPSLAERYRMPLSGTPKQWRLDWETTGAYVVGTTYREGPMLDIVAR